MALVLDIVGWICLACALILAALTFGGGSIPLGLLLSCIVSGVLLLGFGELLKKIERLERK